MAEPQTSAALFAALGDETRLRLIFRLCNSGPLSITRLSDGAEVTRQAITKHLRVMEETGLVSTSRHGRETVCQLNQKRFEDGRRYLDQISRHWDDTLERLRKFVEE